MPSDRKNLHSAPSCTEESVLSMCILLQMSTRIEGVYWGGIHSSCQSSSPASFPPQTPPNPALPHDTRPKLGKSVYQTCISRAPHRKHIRTAQSKSSSEESKIPTPSKPQFQRQRHQLRTRRSHTCSIKRTSLKRALSFARNFGLSPMSERPQHRTSVRHACL
jgi:hypothetical protein